MASRCLTPNGLVTIRNTFASWASPQVQLFLAELTKMVDPNLYDQIIGLYEKRRRKGYMEKIQEATEKKPEEQANVDSMGPF